MPKIHNTRKQRAKELLERLQRGPTIVSLPGIPGYEHIKPELEKPIREKYQLWVRSWIINEVIDLIPELKDTPKAEL